MFTHAEYGWTGRCGVATDAFKHRAAIAGDVSEDVDLGIIPGNESAIVPDLFGRLQHN
jgi:hypothetical protein